MKCFCHNGTVRGFQIRIIFSKNLMETFVRSQKHHQKIYIITFIIILLLTSLMMPPEKTNACTRCQKMMKYSTLISKKCAQPSKMGTIHTKTVQLWVIQKTNTKMTFYSSRNFHSRLVNMKIWLTNYI